ncbi:MAG: hypothetical protein DRO52_01995 [Candidatus Hecatellales archaeon]|nr:MAG: hypothetical protein DRO52_01995 [Candidatus Hecatellales archaeon]
MKAEAFLRASESLERLLRLRTPPVAFALLKDELKGAVDAGRLGLKVLRLCQMVSLSRFYGWTVAAERGSLALTCSYVVGLLEELPGELKREYASYWFERVEDGYAKLESMYRIPPGGFRFAVTAPLAKASFKPDLLLIYLNPAQASIALSALQLKRYRTFVSTYVGESSCSDSIAKCYVTGSPALTIPSFGERRFGHVQDDELVLALPCKALAGLAEGVEELYRRGVRYPIPFLGIRADSLQGLPKRYLKFYEGDC